MSLTINHQTNDISATSGSVTLDGGGVGSPAGSVIYHAANTAPTGFLKANGAAVSRSTYSALFTAIGTTFGSGDGSSTFNVPDLRGEFPRGWDDSRGIDSGRSFGSAQADELKSHLHQAATYSNIVGWSGTSPGNVFSNNFSYQSAGSPNTGSTGGSETRPRNIALLACIKY
jgi:microcystin-dependent protein